ncbi:MAG TPA: phosphatidylglycerophosphatase A, partial [Rhizomicrobium sp.]|nr:phosphatidylglycerophosphatase A [Rhizomicrobium sp.]
MSNVATLFGLGRLGFAPGTLGSLVALPIAWIVMRFGGMYALLGVTAVVAIAAIWVSDAYAKESGDEDPQDCIIDEVAGQMLACALAPLSLAGFALAFVLFRLFDISKLWPISAVERIGGGAGIVG